MNEAGSRQRLRPWLFDQLNTNSIRGLQWVNDEHTMFKIPWKHGGKQDYTEEEGRVFEAWATYTGKYRPNIDKREPARWKTNLRCALNKSADIEEVKAMTSRDDSNPYKVYEFKPPKKGTRRPIKYFDPNDSDSQQSGVPTMVSQQKSSSSFPYDLDHMADPIIHEDMPMDLGEALGSGPPAPEDIMMVEADSTSAQPLVGIATVIPLMVDEACHSTSIDTEEFKPPHNAHMHNGQERSAPAIQKNYSGGLNNLGNPVQASETFEYRLFYLNRPIETRLLLGKTHILYGRQEDLDKVPDVFTELVFGSLDGHKVYLPEMPIDLTTNPHYDDVKELLESARRGFTLNCVNGSIFIKRNCKVSLFYWNGRETVKIGRHEPRHEAFKLFDFGEYCSKVRQGIRETPEIQLYVGQRGSPTELKQLYIVIRLTSTCALQVMQQCWPEELDKEISQSGEWDKILTVFQDQSQMNPLLT